MDPIQLGGLISGMDTQAIIEKLIAYESQPLTRLNQEEAKRTTRLALYQELNTRIKALTDSIGPLKDANLYLGKAVSLSKSDVASVVVTDEAESGSHTLLVKELATSTALKSALYAGRKIDPAAALKDAGLTIAPTESGSFTINGKSIAWNDTMSLNEIITAINGTAGINATASYDAVNDTLSITSTNMSPVTLGASTDSGNFFLAMRLNRAGQSADASGQYTVKSTPHLGALRTTEKLTSSEANLSSPVTQGSFKVNGQVINVFEDDKLQDVLDRITWSAAGVTAAYDAKTDRITLTSKKQGTEFITVSDDTSGFLAATQLADGEYTMGKQANIVLDGTEMWKASNTITDLLDGTTIVLKQASDEAITFSVFQDAEQVKKAVDAFIKAFNSVIETIDKYSGAPEYDGVTLKKAAGDLFGDTTVQSVRFQLKQAIYQTLDGDFRYRSLTSIGMQMGNGTMKDMSKLSLNADMLYDALQTDPEAVSKLFTDPKGFGSILSRASQAQGGDFSGAIKGAIDFETNRIDDIGRRRTDLELRIKNKRNYYVQQFLDMEQKLAKIQSQGTALANQLNVLLNASSGSNN